MTGDARDEPGRTDRDLHVGVTAILAKITGQKPEQLAPGIVYADTDARLNVKDVLHQIDWFKSQGMVKAEVDGKAMLDMRYIKPLPAP